MDWKLKLMQILESFILEEGTFHEHTWQERGISAEERTEILRAFDEYTETSNGGT